ncbi:MAG: TonB-dependent receptor [Sphingomonadales bacterium]|nr:TonB-dependent receptor [Sphingomonadales bacterium]
MQNITNKNTIFSLLLIWMAVGFQCVSAQTGEIRGQIRNLSTNEVIPFANILIQGTTTGTTSDDRGNFRLSALKPGYYSLQISYLGFKTRTVVDIQVFGSRPAIVNVELEEDVRKLEAVEIIASPYTRLEESPVSVNTLGVSEIQRNPGGNRDISKAVQSLPGVSSGVSFRNDIIIRGGAPNENRFYLDGVEVPVINHFATQGSSGGPVGIINVDMIREVDFFSGAFPANRGNTLSSVFEFKQKDPRTDQKSFRAIVGASDVGLIAEGPISDRTSYVVSARRSYLQFLFAAIGLPFLPTFNGFQAKIRHKIDNRNEISFVGLGSIDQFSLNTGLNLSLDPGQNPDIDSALIEQQRYILGYLPVTTQWHYTNGLVYKRYGKKGYKTFVLSRNMLNNVSYKHPGNDESRERIQDYHSQESENHARYEHLLHSGLWKVNYGINFDRARYTVRNVSCELQRDTLVVRSFNSKISLTRYGLFGQVSRTLAEDRLQLSAGLRMDGNTYSPEMQNPLDQLSPRVAMSWRLGSSLSFNAHLGRYFQLPPYTVMGYRDGNGRLLNSVNKLQYIAANHSVAGLEFLGRNNFRSTLEGFFKLYSQYPFLTDQQISLANLGGDFGVIGNAPALSNGRGRSYGIEYLAQQKLYKGTYGILAYTWVRSEFEDEEGKYIPSSWDNRHILTLTAGKIIPNNWELGIRYRYVGGAPTTPYAEYALDTAVWNAFGRAVFDFGRLNTQRAGATQQLDVRVDKKWNYKNWALNLYLDVQNLLNQQTRFPDFWVARTDSEGKPLPDPDNPGRYQKSLIPNTVGTRLPTIGIIVDF